MVLPLSIGFLRGLGVRRPSVCVPRRHNHFATEAEMVRACTSHWIALHPPPDVEAWAAVSDPDERAAAAIAQIYDYYRSTSAMWTTAYRDAGLVEPLGDIMDATWFALLDRAVAVLARGRGFRGRRGARVRGALRLALDFPTWQTLTASGLDDADAARVATAFVAATGAPGRLQREAA